jgi:sulfite exporter TauE/SafE
MLASINPLGERARNQRWGVTYAFYLLGSVAGGATLGLLAGLVGAGARDLVDPGAGVVAAAVLAACVVALVVDLHVARLRSPTVHRQVNENWLGRYRGWVYGLGFGYQLGLGVVTVVTTASVYLVIVLAFLTGSLWGGLVIGAAFGVARALPLLAVVGVRSPGELRDVMRRASDQDRLARWATLAVVLFVAVVAGTVVMGSSAWLS